jgi:hypothetical protein
MYGVDVGDDLGIRSTAQEFDGYSGDEAAGVAGIAEVIAPVGDFESLVPLTSATLSSADASLSVDPALVRDPRTVPARFASMAADEFIPVAGKPRAVTDLTCLIRPTATVGGIGALETYPEPEVSVTDAQARWLPQIARYPASLQWFPFSVNGSEDRLVEGGTSYAQLTGTTWDDVATQPWLTYSGLASVVTGAQGDLSWYSSAGATPTISPSYSYVRGGGFVTGPAMTLRRGQYLFSDTLTWETDQFTVLAVAVLRPPAGEWFSVIDSTPTLDLFEDPVSLRFHRSGVLALWCGGPLGEIQLQAGITRPNQPVIVGFTLNFDDLSASLVAVDTATHVVSTRLVNRPSLRPRLYMGYSRMGGGPVSMDVLEVNYWTAQLSVDQVVARAAQLDRMYGVSSS